MHVIFVHSKQTQNCPKIHRRIVIQEKEVVIKRRRRRKKSLCDEEEVIIYIYLKEEDGTCSYSSHQNRQQALRDVSLFL